MRSLVVLASTVAAALFMATSAHAAEGGALTLTSARVSLDGTSNIHPFTASTADVRVTGIELGGAPTGDVLSYVLEPNALGAFEVVIPTAGLKSENDDLTKNRRLGHGEPHDRPVARRDRRPRAVPVTQPGPHS